MDQNVLNQKSDQYINRQSHIRSVIYCALSIALIIVSAWITVPFGPVPFTLQTLTVLFVIFTLTPKQAIIVIGGYLLLGAIGLPVFSSFRGGLAALLGPTGGFLLSYLVGGALVIALAQVLKQLKIFSKKKIVSFFGTKIAIGNLARNLIIGLLFIIVSYLFGMAWFMFVSKATIEVAFITCVAPFILVDLLKLFAAIILSQVVGRFTN